MAIGNNMSQKRANGLIAIETITKSLAIKHALLLGLNQKIISLCNILVRFIVRPTMASEILLVMFHQNNASFSQCERLLFYKDYYIDQEPSLQSHFGTTTTYITKHGANDIISYFLYSLLDQCFLFLLISSLYRSCVVSHIYLCACVCIYPHRLSKPSIKSE